MNVARQALFVFISLIALAIFSWYFAKSVPQFRLDQQTLYTTTDIMIHDVVVHQFDSQGRLANYLSAPLLRHIPQNNTHWIKQPYIIVKQGDRPAWQIRSQEAKALFGGYKITFSKDVVMHQDKEENSPESTFLTEQITYFPKQKRAHTSQDVVFKQPGNEIRAKGLRADLDKKRIQLLSQARGSYDPNQS